MKTRTRFSVFEIWYQHLVDSKALGTFRGWDDSVLSDVSPGDTVEFSAELEVVPMQTLFHLFLWFAQQARTQGSLFFQKGDDAQATPLEIKMLKEAISQFTSSGAEFGITVSEDDVTVAGPAVLVAPIAIFR